MVNPPPNSVKGRLETREQAPGGTPVIQVAGKRFSIPAGASLSIEHEAEGSDEELEMQLRWKTA